MDTMLHWSSSLSWASLSRALLHEQPQHALSLYRGAAPPWAMNRFKGSFGERVLTRSIASGLFETDSGPWTAITPHRSGGAGIDQLFIRVDSDGRPVSLIVAEAKFGHARLGETTAGLQMSDAWTRPRLAATARDYARAADALRVHRTVNAISPGARALAVPVPGFGIALVVVDDDRVSVRCRDGVPTGQPGRAPAPPYEPATRGRQHRQERLPAATPSARVPRNAFDVKLDVLDDAGGMTANVVTSPALATASPAASATCCARRWRPRFASTVSPRSTSRHSPMPPSRIPRSCPRCTFNRKRRGA